jgi:hypothetical protein
MDTQTAIIIQCSAITPRLTFIVNYLSSVFRFPFSETLQNNSEVIPDSTVSFVIHYGSRPVGGAFNIFASGLIQETGIRNHEPEVIRDNGQAFLYPSPSGFDMPFDIFSALFYLLSRYEEYLPFAPDRYGRFEANQSLAFRHDFLEEPVADQWMDLLREALCRRFPGIKLPEQKYRFVSTLDVDSPWAYRHKGFWRVLGGLVKKVLEMNLQEVRYRMEVLRGKRHDPFDTYDFIEKVERTYNFRSVFFFLSGNRSRYDENYALDRPCFKALMARLKSGHTIGMHPSWRTNRGFPVLLKEFEHFARILGEKPVASRQHFLLLTLPETYRHLIDLGMLEDHSMGYASCPGFRAGTSMPFRFFDLKAECETSLLIHPFQVLDVTLRQYLALTPEEALARIDELIEKVKAVNGTFTSLWHNESLSEHGIWKGWRRVFEGMARSAMEG